LVDINNKKQQLVRYISYGCYGYLLALNTANLSNRVTSVDAFQCIPMPVTR